jgi:hypothetical protein
VLHDLVEAVRVSRRVGPQRADLLLLGHAIDAVVDKVDELARWWSQSPVAVLTDVVLAVRDAARDGGHAVNAVDDPARLRVALDRLHDDADELRRLERAGRARLLVDQSDPSLALRGHGLLECVGEARRACIGLRDRLAACTMA